MKKAPLCGAFFTQLYEMRKYLPAFKKISKRANSDLSSAWPMLTEQYPSKIPLPKRPRGSRHSKQASCSHLGVPERQASETSSEQ